MGTICIDQRLTCASQTSSIQRVAIASQMHEKDGLVERADLMPGSSHVALATSSTMAGLRRLPPPPNIWRVAAPSLGCRFSPICTRLSCSICMSALTGSKIRRVDTVGLKPLPSTSRERLVASTESALDILSRLSTEDELLVAVDCSLLGA